MFTAYRLSSFFVLVLGKTSKHILCYVLFAVTLHLNNIYKYVKYALCRVN